MNPYSARAVFRQFAQARKRKTKALAKIGKIFAVAQSLHNPVGCEQQGNDAHQQAVDKIH
jgi:hypothetical protein